MTIILSFPIVIRDNAIDLLLFFEKLILKLTKVLAKFWKIDSRHAFKISHMPNEAMFTQLRKWCKNLKNIHNISNEICAR